MLVASPAPTVPEQAVAFSPAPKASANDVNLSPFAKRCPKPRRTGDAQADSRSELEYAALQQVITILQENPGFTLETLGGLQRQLRGQRPEPEDKEPRFSEKQFGTLGRIPDDWLAGWLQSLCNGALSNDLLAKVLRADPGAIVRLRRFALQMSDAVRMPPACQVKKICSRVLTDRHSTVGSPLNHDWVTANINGLGEINWKSGG